MNYVWCHGPYCHTHQTVDRVRGSKGNKVLRTRKVKQYSGYQLGTSFYNYFCSMHCYNEFANEYVQQIVKIAPRTEPLETPCEVEKETHKDYYNNEYVRTYVKKIDTED